MSGLLRCGVCGAGMGPAMEECVRCGAPAAMAAPPPSPNPMPSSVAAVAADPGPDPNACESCGARLTDGIDWCGRCFTPRRAAVPADHAAVSAGARFEPAATLPSAVAGGALAPGVRVPWEDDRTAVQYAGWGARVLATLIDLAIVVVPSLVTQAVLGVVLAPPAMIVVGVFAFWNVVFRQGRTGQSYGKEAMHIALVHEQGRRPIGPLACFVRGFAHWADSIPLYVGWLWPLWDAKHQTFADKIQGTIVIKR